MEVALFQQRMLLRYVKVQLDWQLIMQLSVLLKSLPGDKPIFVDGKVYNSTANGILGPALQTSRSTCDFNTRIETTHASLLPICRRFNCKRL